VYVVNPSSNSTVARGLCKYTLNNFYYVTAWMLDYNACVQTFQMGMLIPMGLHIFMMPYTLNGKILKQMQLRSSLYTQHTITV